MPLLCNQASAPTQLHDARAVGTISHSLQRDITLTHGVMEAPKCNMLAQGFDADRLAAGWSLGQSLGGILLALESSNGVGR